MSGPPTLGGSALSRRSAGQSTIIALFNDDMTKAISAGVKIGITFDAAQSLSSAAATLAFLASAACRRAQ